MKINLQCPELTVPWNEKWQAFFECCDSLNVPSSCGLTGSQITSDGNVEVIGDVEICNYGFNHPNKKMGSGDFKGTNLAQQISSIENTQVIIQEYFGYRATSFGVPHNLYDHTLISALQYFDEIDQVYHIPYVPQKRSLSNRFLITTELTKEGGIFNLDHTRSASEHFIHNESNFIVNIHPGNGWGEDCLRDFTAFVKEVRSKGYEFTNARNWTNR